jgi:hypothetical protein
MHADRSGEIAAKGINVTVVQAGAKKTQFSQLNALSPEAQKQAEGIVGDIYNDFAAHVAAGRGMSVDAVKATEADVFAAKDAKKIGLIDAVVTQDQFHLAMVAAMRKGKPVGAPMGNSSVSAILKPTYTLKGTTMSGEFIHTAEDLAQAKAEGIAAGREAGMQAAKTEGLKAGVTAERERITAILALEESKGREAQAQHIALKTQASVEDAQGILAASPVAVAPNPLKPSADLLADAMKAQANGNPDVGADASLSGSGAQKTAAQTEFEQIAHVRAQFAPPSAK